MSEYFASDGVSNHLVDGPWAFTAFCGSPTTDTAVPDDDPTNLCWACAFEWADREIAALTDLSDNALMTVALIDRLIADGQTALAETVLRDTRASNPDLFAEVESLRSRTNMVVAA